MLNYDDVLTSVGEFGPYQKRLCFYMFIIAIPNGLHLTVSVFNNVAPDFRCSVPGLRNDSFTIHGAHHESWVQTAIPLDEDGEHLSTCEIYRVENVANGSQHKTTFKNDSTVQCDQWVYDEEGAFSQVVDFDLVCDRAIYKAHGNLMLLLGMLVGSILGGTLSDIIGRKASILGGVVVQTMIAIAMAFAPSVHVVMALRFFLTLTGSTSFQALFVLLAETVGVSKRSMATISSMVGFTVGQFVMTLVQYCIPNWRTAQLVQSIPFLGLAIFWWIIQESPRWLLTKNREEEAKVVIAYIAKVNKVNPPQEIEMMTSNGLVAGDARTVDSDEGTIWQICSQPKIAFHIAILCFSWVTVNLVYYGLSLGVGDLIQGDIYVNFSLQSAMEIISHVICVFVLERAGRRIIFCSTMIVSGISTCSIGALVLAQGDIQWLSIALFCLGKLGVTIAFSMVFIITTELLPTKIRNSGLGFCACVARISGIVSPYVVSASLVIPGPLGKAFPVLVFGVLSLTSGLSAILLPETRNKELPETFDDNQNYKSASKSPLKSAEQR